MKSSKILLALTLSLVLAQNGYCSTAGSLGSKINLQDSIDISSKANQCGTMGESAPTDLIQSPFFNAASIGSMIQGASGYNSSAFSTQEYNKQQMDYAKQNVKNGN